MSVFSIIKRGRAQAKEHNAKKAEKAKEEAVKLPYKHVVTHAASDALSGAPSSWRHTDKPKIMEQNKRRTAIMESETNMAGMPRVGNSLSYGSFASVYATPIVPLPKNYSYNNIPTSWREQLANFQDGRNSLPHPGSVAISKGKEPEYVRPSSSAGPFPRLSPGQSSTVSSKGMSINGSSVNLSGSDDELEMKNKTVMNHRPQGVGYHPSLSQQSSSSSEKSYRAPFTSSGTTVEAPVKTDRHYPPPAQSTYFSAPRPPVRRTVVDTSIPPISSVRERVGSSTSSLNTSGQFSAASSITSIGVAITPPWPPSSVDYSSPPPTTEDRITSEQKCNETETSSTTHVHAPRKFPMAHFQASADTITEKPNKQIIPTAAPAPQRRRRRLSKSRPPSIDDSGSKLSIETVRPTRSSLTASPYMNGFDFGQSNLPVERKVEEPTIAVTPGSVRKTPGKLNKNPEAKRSPNTRWSSRFNPFSGKTPAVIAH
ncbi:hypothetical protein K449DRAFT_396745 [Hypoxylon sp. EC38]|nr:hypothetical protein K449DRAFT_396745 [Hypoxylon sp. EC38]